MSFNQEEISDEELASLTSAIKNRYDIDFTNYESKSLKRGFARLIMKKKLGSVLGLWSKILRDREFFLGCVDDLTVNLTELFRNPEIWIKLKEDVMKEYAIKSKIKMWHAGCSSGEEVYTMAIVLRNLNMLRRTKTLATDLSGTILEQAKKGEYSTILMNKYLKSFRSFLSDGNLEDSFEFNERKAIVKKELKQHITYKKHNLVQDPMYEKFDIIFCRNVMIYFDDTLKNRVMQLFYDSLEEDGLFIIGYYDMLPEKSKDLFDVIDARTRIYRKKKA